MRQDYSDGKGNILYISTGVRDLPIGHKGTDKAQILKELRHKLEKKISFRTRTTQEQVMFVGSKTNIHHSPFTHFSSSPENNTSWMNTSDFHDTLLPRARDIGYTQARIEYLEGLEGF